MAQLAGGIGFGCAASIVAGSSRVPGTRHRMVLGGEMLSEAWRRGATTMKGMTRHDCNARAADALAEMTGAFKAADCTSYAVNWTDDRFFMGTFLAPEPGQLTRLGPWLARSHGAVHFAAAERSSRPDSLEGAVESGEDSAADVLRCLQS